MGEALQTFINDLIEYPFLQHALSTSLILGIACGMVGCFIILRGLALMGDAISHSVLPGVAISYILNISYFFGAVAFGILAALGIGFVQHNSKIKTDSAIGIVFSAFLALGILMVTKIESSINLNNILFGNVLTITTSDRILTEVMAKASGFPVKLINYLLMVMLTLITVVSLQTVGVILVVSLLITPATTAFLLTQKLTSMLWLSASIGAVSAVIGLFFSVTYNLPSGVMIVLIASTIFLIVFLFNPKTGLVWQHSTNKVQKTT